MESRVRLIALLVAMLAGTGIATAQPAAPAYSARDLVTILKPVRVSTTRSLTPGTGEVLPEPGQPGSGLVPDLQVLFPFNSAELTADTRRQLDELGQALASDELATYRFELAGHTDALGSEDYNETLSARRAEAVAGYLESKFGVAPKRLEARGYGKSQLIDPANPASPKNRRVEIVTLE